MVELVKCSREYWEFVRTLRMDERVVDGFIQKTYITEEAQIKYMSKYNDNYYICLCDGVPAGFVGSIEDDIRVCTHPDYQNRGIGKFMIDGIMKIFPNAFGKVKINNELSKKLFESCGFKPAYIIYNKHE
jgi:ribosomal protein S18 acetylase RimI-like enzyme